MVTSTSEQTGDKKLTHNVNASDRSVSIRVGFYKKSFIKKEKKRITPFGLSSKRSDFSKERKLERSRSVSRKINTEKRNLNSSNCGKTDKSYLARGTKDFRGRTNGSDAQRNSYIRAFNFSHSAYAELAWTEGHTIVSKAPVIATPWDHNHVAPIPRPSLPPCPTEAHPRSLPQ